VISFRLPRGRTLSIGQPPGVMGVLNVTPDSFSDGGVHFDHMKAVHAALQMAEDGAAVIDVGGESTRPGAEPVSGAEELGRVQPVIEGLTAARTGAQISIVTRSGGNQFHGSAFDYLRNDIFDAGDWFNGYTNTPALPKAEERQNDFGGTVSGPLLKNRTFFFFSYEGLRLRLPTTSLSTVPDASFTPGGTTDSRQNATPALQPYLNAYPLPNRNSPEILCNPTAFGCPSSGISGSAAFNTSYSLPASLDAYGLRVDHKFTERVTVFGRYSYSPSETQERGVPNDTLNSITTLRNTTQSGTIGVTVMVSPHVANEFRFNYSRTDALSRHSMDNLGGAVPLSSLPFPSGFDVQNSDLVFNIIDMTGGSLELGADIHNLQRQINVVDNVSLQKGPHNLKFGVDYRRLSPQFTPFVYAQNIALLNVAAAETGSLFGSTVFSYVPGTLLFRNWSAFAQDSWHVLPRLTVTYGVRWDADLAPASTSGAAFPAATHFSLADPSQLALAPVGTPSFKTSYRNFAPRVGVAYEASQKQNWGTVVRGGFGVFYDLATTEAANIILLSNYPFENALFTFGGSFPLDAVTATPPTVQPPSVTSPQRLAVFDPNLKLPYTLQWNVAVEQGLGARQSLSTSYVGSIGRRLIQTSYFVNPNPSLTAANLVANTATSDYHALQIQFKRQLIGGLQVLASYTWAHSIDTASGGSIENLGNGSISGTNFNVNRGPSDLTFATAFLVRQHMPFRLRNGSRSSMC